MLTTVHAVLPTVLLHSLDCIASLPQMPAQLDLCVLTPAVIKVVQWTVGVEQLIVLQQMGSIVLQLPTHVVTDPLLHVLQIMVPYQTQMTAVVEQQIVLLTCIAWPLPILVQHYPRPHAPSQMVLH